MTHFLPFMLSLLGASHAAVGPNVAYFRNHNQDRSSELNVDTTAESVILSEWDVAINLFDTVKDVKVQRIDVTGEAGTTVSLYSQDSPLRLDDGPMYIFHNATQLDVIRDGGETDSASNEEAVLWISGGGSCVHFDVTVGSNGVASLMVVTSGAMDWTAVSADACAETTVLIGAGIPVGGGKKNWIYNRVQYDLTNPSSCKKQLSHGTNGYSQTDEPIGPLDAHYHTRGALYYTQYGEALFNDEAAPDDTVYGGELRFVNAAVYYGPEVMDRSTCFVASVHESDPAALHPTDENPTSECPFACMNTLDEGETASLCTSTEATTV